jgi:hypothetical protein
MIGEIIPSSSFDPFWGSPAWEVIRKHRIAVRAWGTGSQSALAPHSGECACGRLAKRWAAKDEIRLPFFATHFFANQNGQAPASQLVPSHNWQHLPD